MPRATCSAVWTQRRLEAISSRDGHGTLVVPKNEEGLEAQVQPLLLEAANPAPENKTPYPDHPQLSRARDSSVLYRGGSSRGTYPRPRSRQRQEGRQPGAGGSPPRRGLRKGCGRWPRGRHSSLCRGRHWGDSRSSRTPSGAHTQGSCVSHCHLASWARSSSSTAA